MKVAIIGYGLEGESSYRYWTGKGADITVRDQRVDLKVPAGVKTVLGPDYLKGLDDYDLVVRSPGVKPRDVHTKAPVTTALREFMKECPARIIGVTGMKGKGTTCTLISRILGEAGWRTWLGGGIGRPPLDFVSKVRASHLVVLELSSEQLMDLEVSPHIAVCLAVGADYPVWHRSAREYVAAMGNIFWHQQLDDVAVFDAKSEFSAEIAQLSPGTQIPYLRAPGARVERGRLLAGDTDLGPVSQVGLPGGHNIENVCAAVTAVWDLVGEKPQPVQRAIKSFPGLMHRLEPVREVGRVRYVDDASSSSPQTAIAAMRAFLDPMVVILAARDQAADYDELARTVAEAQVRNVVLIGDGAGRLSAALESAGFRRAIRGPRSMAEIVSSARALAAPGDVVLLTPGGPLPEIYKDYQDFGDQFQAAVASIK